MLCLSVILCLPLWDSKGMQVHAFLKNRSLWHGRWDLDLPCPCLSPGSGTGPRQAAAGASSGLKPRREGERSPVRAESSPQSQGMTRSPSAASEPLLLPGQSHFQGWQKVRAWRRWGTKRKMHCPRILVSVKDLLYIYINNLYICIYVCVRHL